MNLKLPIPDELAELSGVNGTDLSRRALAALAIEEYRAGHLTDADLRRMFGLSLEDGLRGFLTAHGFSELGRPQAAQLLKRRRTPVVRPRAMRKGVTLGGLSIKHLINEGRR